MANKVHNLFRDQTAGKKKRERTRGLLLDSAISVFATKGFEASKIIDITNHADMANGTFYNYYETKEDLLKDVAYGLAVEVTGRINDEMSEIEHGPTRVTLATAKFLQIARREPEWIGVLLNGVAIVPEMQSDMIQYFKQDLKIGINQGHFTIDLNLLLVNQHISLLQAAMLTDPKVSDKTIDQTCQAVLRLLGITPVRAARQVTSVFKTYL